MTTGCVLPAAFYDRPVLEVARDLLGMVLVRVEGGRRRAGRIVEVEAYDGTDDLACHASRGRTKRTEPMFGEAGHAYIYLVYGMHHCLNVVTGPPGHPAAVLLRALEPIEGAEWTEPGALPPRSAPQDSAASPKVAAGPGRLTRALGIDLSLNRADLRISGDLFIEAGKPITPECIVRGPRIGVDYAGPWARKPWRLGVRGSPALSLPFPATRPTRLGRRGRGRPS